MLRFLFAFPTINQIATTTAAIGDAAVARVIVAVVVVVLHSCCCRCALVASVLCLIINAFFLYFSRAIFIVIN